MGNGWSNRQKKSYRTTPGFVQLEEGQRGHTVADTAYFTLPKLLGMGGTDEG